MTITVDFGTILRYPRAGPSVGKDISDISQLCKNPAISERIRYELQLIRMRRLFTHGNKVYMYLVLPANSFIGKVISSIVASSAGRPRFNYLRWTGLHEIIGKNWQISDWIENDTEQILVLSGYRVAAKPNVRGQKNMDCVDSIERSSNDVTYASTEDTAVHDTGVPYWNDDVDMYLSLCRSADQSIKKSKNIYEESTSACSEAWMDDQRLTRM